MKRNIVIFIFLLLALIIISCPHSRSKSFNADFIKKYTDIPGITETEINAIEELKKRSEPLIYASSRNTELFENLDGSLGGYTVLLCDWLSELFEIPFQPAIQGLGAMLANLSSGDISFATLSDTPERRQNYFVAGPIAQRSIKMLRVENSQPLSEIMHERLPRYAFTQGSVMLEITAAALESGSYEPIIVPEEESAYHALINGDADAFITNNNMEAAFDHLGGIHVEDFLPLIFLPASMMAENPEYQPIISLINKAIDNGASGHLTDLYRQGYEDYKKHKFQLLLTDEEKAYIRDNPVIPIGSQYITYPQTFYNTNEGKWDGIAFDIGDELALLTGLEYVIVNEPNLQTADLMPLLESGEIYLIPYMVVSNDRIGRFLWSESEVYLFDRFALLSKQDFPNIELNDIPFKRVGLPARTTFAEKFMEWFPNALYVTEYATADDAFLALDKGEIDLVMNTQSRLTALTNYYELSDYKANFIFNQPFEAYIAFNKEQQVLRSIIDKALQLINTDRITEQWLSRTYDIEAMRLREQRPWLIGAIVFSLTALAFLLFTSININKKNKTISKQAAELSSLLVKTKKVSDFELMKHILTIKAMNVALWDKDITYGAGKTNTLDGNDVFRFSNELRAMLGYENEEDFPNKLSSWLYSLHPDDKENAVNEVITHLKDRTGKTPYDTEFRLITKSGEYRHFHSYGETLRDANGVPVRMAGAMKDITEEKQMAEALKTNREKLLEANISEEKFRAASEAKSLFLANMSHEIRTPMNSIIGFTELALDNDDDSKIKEYLKKISESSELLLTIINDILDISKIEFGKMELEKIPFDLHDIFSYCRSLILPRAEEKGLDLYCYAEPSVGKKLIGDPIKLRQALLNILSNAVKFTNTGTVKILASIKKTEKNSVTVYFEIKDSGIGMNTEQINKIFEPFVQADSSIKRKYGGTGLGLSITKNIIEMMGGKLKLESSVGIGSKFSFDITFDTIDVADYLPPHHERFYNLEKPYFEGEVLVCEDNSMNQEMIRDHLKRVGLKAVIASDGQHALDIILNRKKENKPFFELIFMDIHMPVMDGYETTAKITEFGIKTPIIAMTANVVSSDLDEYKKLGMVDCLGKPFTSQELWRILLKYLKPVKRASLTTQDTEDDDELLKKLKLNFVKNNQNIYTDTVNAVNNKDFILAHRLAHSLKSNAGQIGEKQLQLTAAEIEKILKENNSNPPDALLSALKTELESVLEKLAPLLAENNAPNTAKITDRNKIIEILKKLEPLLETNNTECHEFLNDIYAIQGAEKLAKHIEKFEFEDALTCLNDLVSAYN